MNINYNDPITRSVAAAAQAVMEKKQTLPEGKMKELHALMKKGIKDPKKIAKELGLKGTKEVYAAIEKLVAEQYPETRGGSNASDFIDLHSIDKNDDPEQEKQSESTEIEEAVDNFFGFPTKDGLVKFQSMAKKLKIKPISNPVVMKRGGKEFHVMGFEGSVRDIEKAMKVAAGMQEKTNVTEALSKNDKTAGFKGRDQFDLKDHIMPLVKKNKSLKDVYFDGPDLVGDTKKGQPTIAKGVLTDPKMTVGDLEKVIKNFKESTEDAEITNEILEKKTNEKYKYDFEEGNEFTVAAAKAKLAGEDEFEFDGKTFPTEIGQDAAEKILGKKEEKELEENRAIVYNPRMIKAFIKQAEKKFPKYKGEIQQAEDDEIVFPNDPKLINFFKGAKEVKFVLKDENEIAEAPKFGYFNSTFQGSEKVFKDLEKDLDKAGLKVQMIGKPEKDPDIGPMERIIDFYAIGAVADVKKVKKKLEGKYELSLSTLPEQVNELEVGPSANLNYDDKDEEVSFADVNEKEFFEKFDEIVKKENLSNSLTEEELDEIIGKALKAVGRGVKKAAGRLSTAGRAAAATKKADKLDKKAADRERLKKAKERIRKAKEKEREQKAKERMRKKAQARLKQKLANSVEIEEEIQEAIKPEIFAKGGDTKATKRDVDSILSKLFMNNKLAKQVEDSEAYKAGFKSKGKGKNPYKKDTADFHIYILGQQAAQAE